MKLLSSFMNPEDLRILVVDDNPQNLQLLGNHLKELSCQILFSLDGRRALETVRQRHPHLILLDIQMPEIDGFEVCRKLKDNPETADIPVIFLTAAYKSQEKILEGFRSGGVDYITKPYHKEELLARVKTHLALKAYQEHFRDMSIRDPLTRLFNRRMMGELLAREEARQRRDGRFYSIGLCDLDNFKQVNDVHGHAGGDELLIAAAKALQDSVREKDAVGRWGGEEFLVLLPDTDLASAKKVLERVLEAIRSLTMEWEGRVIDPTMTCGVADSTQADTSDKVISLADDAMYQGKMQGKDRLVLYSYASSLKGSL